jgi:hypothetical protein
MVQDVRPGLEDGHQGFFRSAQIGNQHFDANAGTHFADGFDGSSDMLCSAVG